MKLKISILTAVLVMAATSCLKNEITYDTDDIDYRSLEFAAPIAKIHAPLWGTIQKHLDFDDLYVENGVICVRYTQTEGIEWSNEIGMDEVTQKWHYVLPQSEIQLPVEVTVPQLSDPPYTHSYNIERITAGAADTYVKEAKFSSGELVISLDLPDGISACEIKVVIPELEKDGTRFEWNNGDASVDLTGYILKVGDNGVNLNCEFRFTGKSVTGDLEIDFHIRDIEVEYLKGYFGKLEEVADFTMEFDFFDELDFNGKIGIKDVKIVMDFENHTGIPVDIEAREISFVGDNGNKTELLRPFSVSVPSAVINVNNGQIIPGTGTKSHTQQAEPIEFEKDRLPNGIVFNFAGVVNPNGDADQGGNVIAKNNDATLAKVDFAVIVPLYVALSDFSRKDTIKFDYNDIVGNDEDYVNEVKFFDIELLVENGLPFDITLKAVAIDEDEKDVETIATVNVDAKKNDQRITVKLTQSQLDKFRTHDVKKIVLHTTANTKNNNYEQVKATDFLNVDVSVNFKANIPSNL